MNPKTFQVLIQHDQLVQGKQAVVLQLHAQSAEEALAQVDHLLPGLETDKTRSSWETGSGKERLQVVVTDLDCLPGATEGDDRRSEYAVASSLHSLLTSLVDTYGRTARFTFHENRKSEPDLDLITRNRQLLKLIGAWIPRVWERYSSYVQ